MIDCAGGLNEDFFGRVQKWNVLLQKQGGHNAGKIYMVPEKLHTLV